MCEFFVDGQPYAGYGIFVPLPVGQIINIEMRISNTYTTGVYDAYDGLIYNLYAEPGYSIEAVNAVPAFNRGPNGWGDRGNWTVGTTSEEESISPAKAGQPRLWDHGSTSSKSYS